MAKQDLKIVRVTDKFAKVREALKAYDDHEDTFEEMLEQTSEGAPGSREKTTNDWFAEKDRLRLEVGKEFVKVTPNSADNAKYVSVEFAKEMSGYSNKTEATLAERRDDYIKHCLKMHKVSGIPLTAEQAGERFDRSHMEE